MLFRKYTIVTIGMEAGNRRGLDGIMAVTESLGLQLVLNRVRVMPHQTNLPQVFMGRREKSLTQQICHTWGKAYVCIIHQAWAGSRVESSVKRQASS